MSYASYGTDEAVNRGREFKKTEMKYWISIKEFRQGHQVNSMDDDNEGKGYTKNAAKKKAAIMDNVSFDGPAEGTEAKVYDWAGNPAY